MRGWRSARRKGRKRVCGWEANGGFLTGTDIERGDGSVLTALPTRDAILPILGGALPPHEKQACPLLELFARLPKRFSRAALLKQFPRPVSERIVAHFSPRPGRCGHERPSARARIVLHRPEAGFSEIAELDYTDGVRILFVNGDVAHLRPSGNADELRMYAVADTQERADEIAALGVAEPAGILRRMEAAVLAE